MVTVNPNSNSNPQPEKPQDEGMTVEPGPKDAPAPKRPLDIVFLQDATGSQGPYIQSAVKAIHSICQKISQSPALGGGDSGSAPTESIRFGLIAFRDHPPQDRSYVTKNFGFTSNVDEVKKHLSGLIASGGGDGPEASTAALAEALNMEWKENAVKIVVLITDAPPHGLGEVGDGFPNGSPDQNDPLSIARQMAEHGISLYIIACEPSLSKYKHAVDFYRALTQITSGRMVPLVHAEQLGDYIVGSAIETLETEHLIGQFEKVILEDVYGQGKSVEEVMESVQNELNKRNVQLNTLSVEDIYKPSEVAEKNVSTWAQAFSLSTARENVQEVSGSRVRESYIPGRAVPGRSAAPAQRQQVQMQQQQVDKGQAKRMVMQSLMRNAEVGAGGILKPRGAYAHKGPTSFNI
ncbi:elongation factor-2 kinase [Coprinopsis cinerea okayama7|uniref:Elongation factor-2 kinase n=1 Tax=Coprinopsis cinerea (strain Okayama-7 / 130 / ATCC MYA-4618 / FGSC 9003) TaxID=240176 RepID=A8NMC2_COPC7|nr:elongation factor-2 kinase [Coprinopsis cinerea okayama7\|eukprot:XP_001834887.1 elongation factor-2 kinase [Coprinopsis cinerea okayama7\